MSPPIAGLTFAPRAFYLSVCPTAKTAYRICRSGLGSHPDHPSFSLQRFTPGRTSAGEPPTSTLKEPRAVYPKGVHKASNAFDDNFNLYSLPYIPRAEARGLT